MNNMKKLELKHLAAYLPYGLKVTDINNSGPYLLSSVRNDKSALIYFKSNPYTWNIECVKPILRPLFDLFPEITDELIDNAECDYEIEFVSALLDDKCSVYDKIEFAPFSIIQKLCEKHFDIFGLIEKGLAININTL